MSNRSMGRRFSRGMTRSRLILTYVAGRGTPMLVREQFAFNMTTGDDALALALPEHEDSITVLDSAVAK